MFCSFCNDAGKPLKIITSHFVKEHTGPDAAVVCPTLLQQQCNYCKEKGHTPKYCPKLKECHEKKKACSTRSPFCSVCRDAGRPESEYTSHFVKDQPGPDGKVVCPLLLSQRCRFCNEFGHTPSQCHKLQLKKMQKKLKKNAGYYGGSSMFWDCFTEKQQSIFTNEKNTITVCNNNDNKSTFSRPRLQIENIDFDMQKPEEDIHYNKRTKKNTFQLDKVLTPSEKKEAREIIIQVKKNNENKKKDQENIKGIGNGPICLTNVKDIFTYYDWKRTNPNDRFITDVDFRFIRNDGSYRKISWEEWCDKKFQDEYKIRIMNAKSASTLNNCEEKIHNRMYAQTLYTNTEEDNAMKKADEEFEYLQDMERMNLCFIPKLKRSVKFM